MIQECRQRIYDVMPDKNTKEKSEKIARFLTEAYRTDSTQFNALWDEILTGQNKTGMRFYLVSVYLRMEDQFGAESAGEIMASDPQRIKDLMKYSTPGINMVNRVYSIILYQILNGMHTDAWETIQEALLYGSNRSDGVKEIVRKLFSSLRFYDNEKIAEFCSYLLEEAEIDDEMRIPLLVLRCLVKKEKCSSKGEVFECMNYALRWRKAALILFYNRDYFSEAEIVNQVNWCCENTAPEVWYFYSYDLPEEIAAWIHPYIARSELAVELMVRNDCYSYLDTVLPELIKSRDRECLKKHLVMIMNYGMTHRITGLMSDASALIPEPQLEKKSTVEFTDDGKMISHFFKPAFSFGRRKVNLDDIPFSSEEHARWFLNIVDEALNCEKIERDCQHIRDKLEQIRNPEARYSTFTIVMDFDVKMIAYTEMFFGMKTMHPSQELLNNVDWALEAIERKSKGSCLEPPNKECAYFVDNILNDDERYSDIEEGIELLTELRNKVIAKLEDSDESQKKNHN